MERYWRIAIAIANTHFDEFLSDLVGDVPLLLEIADEVRQSANARLWLFKYHKWDEKNDLIRQLLFSLFKLPDSTYLYIAVKKPFMYKDNSQGSLQIIEDFGSEYSTSTGKIFEDINF